MISQPLGNQQPSRQTTHTPPPPSLPPLPQLFFDKQHHMLLFYFIILCLRVITLTRARRRRSGNFISLQKRAWFRRGGSCLNFASTLRWMDGFGGVGICIVMQEKKKKTKKCVSWVMWDTWLKVVMVHLLYTTLGLVPLTLGWRKLISMEGGGEGDRNHTHDSLKFEPTFFPFKPPGISIKIRDVYIYTVYIYFPLSYKHVWKEIVHPVAQ